MRWLWDELREWWRAYTKDLPLFPVVVLLCMTCLIIIAEVYGDAAFYRKNLRFGDWKIYPIIRLFPHLYWYGASCVLYCLAPLLIIKAFNKRSADFGLQWGDWRLGLKILGVFCAAMAFIVAIALQTETFAGHYPLNKAALRGLSFLLLYESFHVAYFFAWEFAFRGFLLFGLYPVLKNWAILIQMVPFAILHIGKPTPEVFASVGAGLILGAFALRTRSMLYCWLLHAFSALAMDISRFCIKGTWNW